VTGYQETPLLSVSDRNTPENIKNGLMGKVYSNYQLTHVRVTITDNAGKQVGMYETYPYTVQYVSLNSLDLNNEVAKLKKGDYHYELQVSYAGKTETAVSFDFSK